LKIHFNRDFKSRVQQNKQRLIFNASYSSEFNPIETLWALAKRQFGRKLVAECDMKSQAEVEAYAM
jgi:transposase